MKIICNNGGSLRISQELIDSINEIKTNQSQEENVQNIACLAHLVETHLSNQENKKDCIFFLESIGRFTHSI